MLNKRTLTTLFTLALAGSLAVPALAAESIPAEQATPDLKPVVAWDCLPVISDEAPLTRAELISVLYEREEKPDVSFTVSYTDVDPDDAYAEAVQWASCEGIAGGYGNGTFGPDDAVTREQMAVILYRYTQNNGQGFQGTWAFPLQYSDAEEISEFAYEAVCWVTMKDIMGGSGDNMFNPAAEVTHQDANVIFEQYFSVVEQIELANPFITCETMNDAAQVAGFSMELPKNLPEWVQSSTIRAVESSMIEVVYQGEQEQLTLRKGIGTQDISGDYSVYSETSTKDINGCPVTLKGYSEKVMVATWSSGDYTYAVQAADGLDYETMVSIVSDMK